MTTRLSRRAFLALGATVVAGACSADDATPASSPPTPSATPPPTSPPATGGSTPVPSAVTATTPAPTGAPATTTPLPADPFTLGVTSGDPDDRSAVLWTRLLTEQRLPEEVSVEWEVAGDEDFGEIRASGSVPARAAEGHSVHVVVELDGPAWYRFHAGGWTSPSGRVVPTPSATAESLRLATANCQNWEEGFYAAHRDLAEWAPDLVVFLGDFIYEYAGQPVGQGRVRSHDGAEVVDVDSYRSRYAQYLADPDLQAARAACPWLVIWDDHEVENNYAALVPENPSESAGFPARRAAAYQVWWEHMPVRLPPPHDGAAYPIQRRVRWGDLADLILLDGRQHRSDQACNDAVFDTGPPCPEALVPSRTMLGRRQEEWLGEELATAAGRWTVLGQQTVLSDFRLPNGAILNYDQWDGYAPARDRLLAEAATADRVVVLTGDIHLAAVGNLAGVGVEFVTASISSDNGLDPALQIALAGFNGIVDAEIGHRGYTRHTVTADSWTAEYRAVADVAAADSPVSTWRTFQVDAAVRDVATAI